MITSGNAAGRCGASVSEALRLLRPLRLDDETAFRAAYRAMAAEGLTFGPGFEPGTPWSAYLSTLEDQRAGVNLPAAGFQGLSWSPK